MHTNATKFGAVLRMLHYSSYSCAQEMDPCFVDSSGGCLPVQVMLMFSIQSEVIAHS